jgi:hypothetical protein
MNTNDEPAGSFRSLSSIGSSSVVESAAATSAQDDSTHVDDAVRFERGLCRVYDLSIWAGWVHVRAEARTLQSSPKSNRRSPSASHPSEQMSLAGAPDFARGRLSTLRRGGLRRTAATCAQDDSFCGGGGGDWFVWVEGSRLAPAGAGIAS